MRQPLVISVILNTNRREDTLDCLASLARNSYPNQHVIVLDNASSDGSVEAIRTTYPQIQVIQLDKNLGYAGNNNVGIAAAVEQGADWVFVLNEDTVLAPDCIEQLVRSGEQNHRIGIVGPLVFHYDEPQIVQSAGGKLGPKWDAWHLEQNKPYSEHLQRESDVDWISGCALLIRRDVIEQIGMIDERFFYYWEEVDWCLRAQHADWRITLVPSAQLWHKGVQRNYQPKPSVAYYDTRNHLLLMAKHHAPLQAWLTNGGRKLRTLTSYSLRPKWRAHRVQRNAMLQGISDFLFQRWGRGPF